MLKTVYLFVWVKRSTCMLKLNKISRFNMVTKKFDEFVIFYQNFSQKCSIELKFW